jgi:hypothetical protein
MGVEEYLGYWGGTATTMAIVASAAMSDHQKFKVMATLKVAQDAKHIIVAISVNSSQDIDWMVHFN